MLWGFQGTLQSLLRDKMWMVKVSVPDSPLRYTLMVPRSELAGKSAAGIKNVRVLPFVMLSGDGLFVRSVEQVSKK